MPGFRDQQARMNRRSMFFVFGFLCVLSIILSAFIKKTGGNGLDEGKDLFYKYCSSCHMTPNPADLTKLIWEYNVLPPMAARLGIVYPDYDPYFGLTPEEKVIVDKNYIFPAGPALSQEDWDKIRNYIIKNAPDTVAYDAGRVNRDLPLRQFIRKDIQIDDRVPSLITGLRYNDRDKTLWIGNFYNEVFTWKWNVGVTSFIPVTSPVVDFQFIGDSTYLTEIGKLYPSELSLGSIATMNARTDSTAKDLLTTLHRPVNTQIEDLNNDGVPEMVVCNFGNKTGGLSLFKKDKKTGKYTEDVLLRLPGATKCYIKDMDGDGKKDIVALFSQGDESVFILYQKDNLKFKAKRVLRFPPNYGTTDMALVDYNHDGLMDIVTVHGDNADYSPILKSYHGLRFNINQGGDNFQEKFFYPLYGVTRVIADDFDQDGDIDFAASCFFPDFGSLLDESFVYLENTDPGHFGFKTYILKSDVPVKSLTLEKADIDGDGDMDIILGNFAQTPGRVPPAIDEQWKTAKYGLIVFENQLRQPVKK